MFLSNKCLFFKMTAWPSYFIDSTRGDTDQQTTFSLTVTTSNLPASYTTKGHAFSTDIMNNDVTQMTYLPTENDLFKNEFFIHVIQIIVSFIGVFVIVFTIFVIAYIYTKCFRKTTNQGQTNINQSGAQYKSLSFNGVGPESETQPGPQEEDSADCTYLTPVFGDKAYSDTSNSDKNVESIQETSFNGQQNLRKPTNESNSTPDAGLANVYIEITQDNFESPSLNGVFHDNGNQGIWILKVDISRCSV